MTTTMIIVAAVALLVSWFAARRTERVACELDLEATQEHFHAHAVLENTIVQEGDRVLLHGAPDRIALGERRTMAAEATVTHVSWPRRLMVRFLGTTQIADLYDVGFEG